MDLLQALQDIVGPDNLLTGDDVRRRFVFTRGAAFLTVSAKTGEGVSKILPEADAGSRVAHLVSGKMLDYIEVEDGFTVVERDLPREYLYLADEIFMCGTAAEVTPIR